MVMVEIPLASKVIPIAMAGFIALTPIADLAKINKESNTVIQDNGSNNQKTVNDKTNQQTTKIITIREGYKGVILDGSIFEVPYYNKTTVEKTYHEKEQEQGQQDKSNNSWQSTTTRSSEDVPDKTIFTKIINGGKVVVQKIWQKVRP